MFFGIKGKSGFTLLEVMVSLAIMAVALITIIQLFAGALRSAKVSKDYSIALIEAKKIMDMILTVRSLPEFEELMTKLDEEGYRPPDGYTREIIENPPLEYLMHPTLSEDVEERNNGLTSADLEEHLYEIEVKMKWGRDKEISFNTIRMLKKEDQY